jgi:hypothetical protein
MSDQPLDASTDSSTFTLSTEKNSRAITPRRIWVAILLGLIFGPLAQVYCGRLSRAIYLVVFGWLIPIIFYFVSCYLFSGRFTILILVITIGCWELFIPIDAAVLAFRSKETALKKYQRAWSYPLIG